VAAGRSGSPRPPPNGESCACVTTCSSCIEPSGRPPRPADRSRVGGNESHREALSAPRSNQQRLGSSRGAAALPSNKTRHDGGRPDDCPKGNAIRPPRPQQDTQPVGSLAERRAWLAPLPLRPPPGFCLSCAAPLPTPPVSGSYLAGHLSCPRSSPTATTSRTTRCSRAQGARPSWAPPISHCATGASADRARGPDARRSRGPRPRVL
jgi:hypothetical protein